MASQLITQKFCKFFYLLACLAMFSTINASTTITFNDQDVSSVVAAFSILQQRQTDNPLAQNILAKPIQTLKDKVTALHEFNERSRKQQEENQKLADEGLSPVRVGEDFSSKLIAKQSREVAEMQRKLQADMDQEREQQRRELERKEKELKDKEDALAKIKVEVVNLVDKAAALSPLRKELAQERARERATPLKKQLSEAEAELKRLRSQMGCDVLATILEERPESADDGFAGGGGGGAGGGGVNIEEDPLKLELASYYGKIKGINKKLARAAEVIRDCNAVEALLHQSLALVLEEKKELKLGARVETIVDKSIPIDRVDDVLALMKLACDIANNYKPVPFEGEEKQIKEGLFFVAKWVDGHKEKMQKATPKERVTLLESCFELYYFGPIRTEKEAIEAIDTLQLSLDLTLNLEASIASTKKLNLYSPSAFESIDRTITSAVSNFRAEIIRQDRERYENYLEVLEQEKVWAQQDTNFSLCPTILHLLRNPMVLFMFKRPAKKDEADNERTVPFASFGRISDEIRYLTENQKKALFASLYFVVFNYEEVSGKYLAETLLSNTPIQAVDIHPLIKEIKESLKKNFQPMPFTPSTEQQDLAKFSVKVNDLLTGKTYREGITNRFASALISLGQRFNGISSEGVTEYLKTENLPEEQSRIANRILAEHEFISTEALNQQLINKQREVNTYRASLEQSISEKRQREEETRIITAALEEGTLAKSNAQREKKEKEIEIAAFAATLAEGDEAKLVELGEKYAQLDELGKKLLTLNKSLAELGKENKKLVEQIARLTKQIGSLEANIAGTEPEIAKLVDTLEELGFVSELDRLSGDIDGIASRGKELFEFNRTLESCFELLTDLQASTRKRVEAETTGGTSSGSNPSRAVSKLGSEGKSKIEAVLRKAGGTADSDLAAEAAQNAKKLRALAIAAFNTKREADALAAAAAAVVVAEKPPARPAAFAAAVVTAESLEQELVLIEAQLADKQIDEEARKSFVESIKAARANIETAIPTAQMKISRIKKELKKTVES